MPTGARGTRLPNPGPKRSRGYGARPARLPRQPVVPTRRPSQGMHESIWVEVDLPYNDWLLHDFRNFGEDVYRALHAACDVRIQEIDRSVNGFAIRDVPPDVMPDVRATLERLFHEYGFEHVGRVLPLRPDGRGGIGPG